jgi:hypothetical protein
VYQPPHDLISREIDGAVIPQRSADGYVNATAMCKAAGKQLGHYLANQATKDFLEALSSDIGIPISALVIAKKGGLSAEQGTWIHPDVAVNLGQWCSPKFAVAVSKWVREWMTTGVRPSPVLDFSDPLIAAKLYVESEEGRRIALAEVKEVTEAVRPGECHPSPV